jgi:hypothetical protein
MYLLGGIDQGSYQIYFFFLPNLLEISYTVSACCYGDIPVIICATSYAEVTVYVKAGLV